MGEKCQRYERPTSFHQLNFPTQNFHSIMYCIILGHSYLENFSPKSFFFLFQGSILLLGFQDIIPEH
jgi:hypothetical protein